MSKDRLSNEEIARRGEEFYDHSIRDTVEAVDDNIGKILVLDVDSGEYEIDEGELIPVTSPTPEHQDIIVELGYVLRRWVRDQQLGRVFVEVDAYLPDGRVYIPDFSFLSTDRMSLLDPGDRKIHGSPDLVVEITSGKPDRDRVRKFRIYYQNGVPWYWIIDQESLAIEEYHATPDGYLRTASIASGEEVRPQLF